MAGFWEGGMSPQPYLPSTNKICVPITHLPCPEWEYGRHLQPLGVI